MSKPKLLTWHDFLAPTGFAVVAQNLLKGFEEDFDIEVCAINFRGGIKYDTSKYFIHPLTDYRNDNLNVNTLINRAKEWKPDIIFLFQDIFNIDTIIKEVREASPHSKIISYFPVDGTPLSPTYSDIFKYSDKIIAYTQWALKVIKGHSLIDKPIEVLYHGVDNETFFPLPEKAITTLRKDINWKNKFVMGLVAKNQPRKQIESTLRVFGMFAKGFKECTSCGHKMPKTQTLCELCSSEFLNSKGREKPDVVLYLHSQTKNPRYGRNASNDLVSKALNSGFHPEDLGHAVSINSQDLGKVSPGVLNEIYNCMNIHVTSTVGEGCGLPLLESMAVGTPSIAPKHSAIPEMLGDTGRLVKNKAIFSLPNDNGHFRPIIDEEDYLFAMEEAYLKWKKSGKDIEKKPDLIDRALEKFSWVDKRDSLKRIFKSALPT
jgi:glycosyltransferase involved in cell wall biosynthesis